MALWGNDAFLLWVVYAHISLPRSLSLCHTHTYFTHLLLDALPLRRVSEALRISL